MSNNTATKSTAWNCAHCHATNVTPRCGCAASVAPSAYVDSIAALNAIVLTLPARKVRK